MESNESILARKIEGAQALLDEARALLVSGVCGSAPVSENAATVTADGSPGRPSDSTGGQVAAPEKPEKAGAPSRKLRVAIVVGHEPTAPGAVNPKTRESEFAFNDPLADLVMEQLIRQGDGWIEPVKVYRAPEGYSALPAKVNATGADFAIELHANASDGTGNGTEMIFVSPEGKRLAEFLQARVLAALELKDRGVKTPWAGRGEYLLKNTVMPCVIAEPFFIDHAGDYARAKARGSVLASAYAGAVLDYAHDRWERGLWR
jgi:N-acetylmuramoyl-L-alanine amidase